MTRESEKERIGNRGRERGGNIAVGNGRESASVGLADDRDTTHRTVSPGRHLQN